MRKGTGTTFVAALATAVAVTGLMAPASSAATDPLYAGNAVDAVGTVDVKYQDGRVEVSAPLWTAQVPTTAWITKGADKCRELPITVTPQVGLDTLEDLDVEFELWTVDGQQVASDSIYSTSWNPSGGPTQAGLFDCDYAVGTYTLFVTTQYELSTNGLLSRYLEGKQQFSFRIQNDLACAKGPKLSPVKRVAADACPTGWVKVQKACAKSSGGKVKILGVKAGRCPAGWTDVTNP